VTAPADTPRPRSTLIVPVLCTLLGVALLIGLGVWQLERRAWKEALIASIARRMNAPPVPLPPPQGWANFDAAHDEFTRVTFRATFEHDQEALVFAGASAMSRDEASVGYWVFTPARLPDGVRVVVNRGFVPEDNRDPETRAAGLVTGPVEIVGALRWPDHGIWFTPAGDPKRNLWFARDQLVIAAAKGWGNVAPFYVQLEAPTPPGGLPVPGKVIVNLPNNHLQYALTWFALAVMLAAVFFAFARARLREEDCAG
jgi:surfeit locus 1 family protein